MVAVAETNCNATSSAFPQPYSCQNVILFGATWNGPRRLGLFSRSEPWRRGVAMEETDLAASLARPPFFSVASPQLSLPNEATYLPILTPSCSTVPRPLPLPLSFGLAKEAVAVDFFPPLQAPGCRGNDNSEEVSGVAASARSAGLRRSREVREHPGPPARGADFTLKSCFHGLFFFPSPF